LPADDAINTQPRSGKQTANNINSTLLNLNDPNIELMGLDEFETVPRYLKGRLSLDRINSFISSIAKLFADKYAILKGNPARLPPDSRHRYYQWREEENTEVQGQFFVSENDLKNGIGKGSTGIKIDPANRSILAILRHTGRLREVRGGGVVRLVLN
jgi:hypothetical protein